MRPEEIVARVWPDRDLALEPLGGGITNHNFKVTVDGESFALRIGGRDTELLGIDRSAYCATAEEHGVRVPDAFSAAKQHGDEIESARGSQPLRPCHNDPLNANFIDDGTNLRIVDWEYAGMGDVFFDLANFSINYELGENENRALLAAYFGELRSEDLTALRLMRFMSDFREAMWGSSSRGSRSSTSTSSHTPASTSSGSSGRPPTPRFGKLRRLLPGPAQRTVKDEG